MTVLKSYKYKLFGDYGVEKQTGKFYKLTKGNTEVYIPESDIEQVEGLYGGGRKSRKTKKVRGNRRRYSRRN